MDKYACAHGLFALGLFSAIPDSRAQDAAAGVKVFAQCRAAIRSALS
jgi:hypothetical protein